QFDQPGDQRAGHRDGRRNRGGAAGRRRHRAPHGGGIALGSASNQWQRTGNQGKASQMDDTTRYRRLLERYRNGDIDRRGFLTLIGAASLTAGLIGGPLKGLQRQALAATPESVRFDGWGGVVSEAFRKYAFDPY